MSKTVNFIEAVNSGKRFRPINEERWFEDALEFLPTICIEKRDFMDVEIVSRIITGEFILEEKSITISEGEFDECAKSMITIHSGNFGDFKKELGF